MTIEIKEITLWCLLWCGVGIAIGWYLTIMGVNPTRVEVVNCTMKPCYLKVNGIPVMLKGGEVKFMGR